MIDMLTWLYNFEYYYVAYAYFGVAYIPELRTGNSGVASTYYNLQLTTPTLQLAHQHLRELIKGAS